MGLEDQLDSAIDNCFCRILSGQASLEDHQFRNELENYVRGNVPARVFAYDLQEILSSGNVSVRSSGGDKLMKYLSGFNAVLAGIQLYGGYFVGAAVSGLLSAYFCAAYRKSRKEREVVLLHYEREDIERCLECRKDVIREKLEKFKGSAPAR